MSQIYSVLVEKIRDPHTKTSDLSILVSTAESIAINILKLESATITAIKQSNIILENHIKSQLPSRSKHQQELPKIIYNHGKETYGLKQNNTINTEKNTFTFND